MDDAQLAIDERFMREALKEAAYAFEDGEVPVGAVIVHAGRVVGRAHNQREILRDPTAHAEMIAITQAAEALDRWRLSGCTMYVTLEPCAMCAGAMVLARIDRLVYGATDPKAGACGSLMNIVEDPRLNHRPGVTRGVLAPDAAVVLQEFFRQRRGKNAECGMRIADWTDGMDEVDKVDGMDGIGPSCP